MDECRRVEKNLIDIVEKRVCGDRLKDIQEHLDSCPGCSFLVKRFRPIWQELDRSQRMEPSLSFWPGLEQKVRAYEERKLRPGDFFRGSRRMLQPIVAILALIAGIFTGYQMGNVARGSGKVQAQGKISAAATEELFTSQYLSSFEDFPKGSVADFYISHEIRKKESIP